ncbi:hypothetical protein OC25_23705 [Pedobacter kyungheensis]|uniref:Uncharacterized protein n=1 Tax=Pedobacter kyungheensis TaxID=1069985 RepID=A0A0C1DAQ8_9SPHI|nr:hypothetical protein OC25_23705 [Pedobacter kyungheensis]
MTCLLQAGFVVPSCNDEFLLGSVIDSQLFLPEKPADHNYLVDAFAILLSLTVIASLTGNLNAVKRLISLNLYPQLLLKICMRNQSKNI